MRVAEAVLTADRPGDKAVDGRCVKNTGDGLLVTRATRHDGLSRAEAVADAV